MIPAAVLQTMIPAFGKKTAARPSTLVTARTSLMLRITKPPEVAQRFSPLPH
jgi:hypothetical protein